MFIFLFHTIILLISNIVLCNLDCTVSVQTFHSITVWKLLADEDIDCKSFIKHWLILGCWPFLFICFCFCSKKVYKGWFRGSWHMIDRLLIANSYLGWFPYFLKVNPNYLYCINFSFSFVFLLQESFQRLVQMKLTYDWHFMQPSQSNVNYFCFVSSNIFKKVCKGWFTGSWHMIGRLLIKILLLHTNHCCLCGLKWGKKKPKKA